MFRVGQKVECIKRPSGDSDMSAPQVGERFTVIWSAVIKGIEVLDFQELPCPASEGWYRGIPAKYFRPIVERTTDISIFTAMLIPSDEKIGASA